MKKKSQYNRHVKGIQKILEREKLSAMHNLEEEVEMMTGYAYRNGIDDDILDSMNDLNRMIRQRRQEILEQNRNVAHDEK